MYQTPWQVLGYQVKEAVLLPATRKSWWANNSGSKLHPRLHTLESPRGPLYIYVWAPFRARWFRISGPGPYTVISSKPSIAHKHPKLKPTGLVEGWTHIEQIAGNRTRAIATAGRRALENGSISLWCITQKEMFLGIWRPDDLVTQQINIACIYYPLPLPQNWSKSDNHHSLNDYFSYMGPNRFYFSI